jgi:rfaE bifunctional protein kinase chain/domain
LTDPQAAIAALAGRRVLVVGDLVLDEYLTGKPSRVSREAPVLILEESGREYRAGSAGSPAANVVRLGSQATIVGAVGEDANGERLALDLVKLGIGCDGIVRMPDTHTATKTRIMAQGIDRVEAVTPRVSHALAAHVAELGPSHDAILLSDYVAGAVSDEVIRAARETGRPVYVDSQGSLDRFAGVDLVKVNQAEAQAAIGSTDVLGQADSLRRHLRLKHLVITLGGDGIAVFSDRETEVIRAHPVGEVFDVTGAGDTVIAVLALGLVGGLSLTHAATLANAAASVVVRRLGVATVSPAELLDALKS